MKKSIVIGVLMVFLLILNGCQSSKTVVEEAAPEVTENPSSPAVEEKPAVEMEVFTVYTSDPNTIEPIPSFEASIDLAAPLDVKLSEVLKVLSKEVFKLPIELVEVQNKLGMNLAVVNLKEDSSGSDIRWDTMHFQGSTGGAMTVTSLVETVLQKNYEGQWIDGVTFLYEGEPVYSFEHVWTLGQTIYKTKHYKLADMAIGDAVGDPFVLSEFIDNKEEMYTYFVLSGEYEVAAHVYFDFDFTNNLGISVVASPILGIEIGLDDNYDELFRHTFTILDLENPDDLKASLSKEQLDRVMAGETIEVEMVLKDIETILYWQSEYYNTVTFVALK